MPKKKYALEKGGPKRLELSWKTMWREFTVRLDDQEVGLIDSQDELKEGKEFPLPDGSRLGVKLQSRMFAPELQVTRDGLHLPGSAGDPEQKVKVAFGIVYFIGGLNLLLGLLAVVFEVGFIQQMGIGPFSIAFGVVFLALGFLIQKKFSVVALGTAVALFVLDAVLSIYMVIERGGEPPTAGLVVRILLVIAMVQGFGVLKDKNQRL